MRYKNKYPTKIKYFLGNLYGVAFLFQTMKSDVNKLSVFKFFRNTAKKPI